jgi:hypothetical protein
MSRRLDRTTRDNIEGGSGNRIRGRPGPDTGPRHNAPVQRQWESLHAAVVTDLTFEFRQVLTALPMWYD